MLNDEDQNAPPSIDESYTTAIGSSNLKHDPDRPSAVNIIIAAGINPHRLGLALLRLRTEWDASAKPQAPTGDHLRALSMTYRKEQSGLVLVPTLKKPESGKPQEMEEVTPMVAAQREAEAWFEVEQRALLQRLKTLPMVRDALTHWAAAEGIEGAPYVVASVVLWWLNNKCQACKGVMKKVVEGTGRTSGKACTKCKGTGETKVPHGFLGRKVASYMGHCRGNAAKDLLNTRRRHHTTKT